MQQRIFSDVDPRLSITDSDEMKVRNEEQVIEMVPLGPAEEKYD
jgi:hypothetical protein